MTSTSVTATARGPQPPFLFRHLTCLTAASEDENTTLPEQRRVTAQITRNWKQHKAIEDRPPRARGDQLHRAQLFDAITRADQGDMGRSILQKDMPDDEDYQWAKGL